jgi:hypothetical protein
MGGTVLDIRCDHAAAPHLRVAVGAGWARITLYSECGRMDDLPRALRMLAAARCGDASPVVRVSGPDAPVDTAPLRREALRVWAAQWAATAASHFDTTVSHVADATVSGATDATHVADAAVAHVADAVVAHVVARVAAHAQRYGAAPDFAATRPAARGKVYNYIRSTSGDPRASDELVEAVRRCLAVAGARPHTPSAEP